MKYPLRFLVLIPLLCHCYSSFTPGNGPGGSDASVADDVVSGDSSFADGDDPRGIERYVPAPLRNTIWVMHDNIIEERRIDDFSVIVDTQPIHVEQNPRYYVHIAIVATEHGCLIRYLDRIRVYDRRSGWSEYEYPDDRTRVGRHYFSLVIRDGYWLMDGVTATRVRIRMRIESGTLEPFNFGAVDSRGRARDLVDGLDGRLNNTLSVTVRLNPVLRTWFYDDGVIFPTREISTGETGPLPRYSRRSMAMRDGAVVVTSGLSRTWTLLERDSQWNYSIRHEREGWLSPYGPPLPTADDQLFFMVNSHNPYEVPNRIEVTIHKTNAEFDDAEVVLGPVRWMEPVRMALGDPIQRIANTPR